MTDKKIDLAADPIAADELENILMRVRRPGRYSGGEFNLVKKEWHNAALRFALVFPDLYEIGMSHQGLQILYHLINGRDDLLAERSYCPAPDLEEILRRRGLPLFSLESRRGLGQFDILAITLPYELCYSNILTILDLAGLPFYARDRGEDAPLVIGGGPCAFHPEPVADFFDAILLGDGEEAVLEIADTVIAARDQGLSRLRTLERLAGITGVYVPAFFAPCYDESGQFAGMDALYPGYNKVRRRILADIDRVDHLKKPLVPTSRIVHDRLGIEVARGCTRGCRFCQAGIIYRPARERTPADILQLARDGIETSGFDELALLSLSTGDYSCLPQVLVALVDEFLSRRVSLSMPSMRVGTLTPEVMSEIKKVRKTGFTLAPEAGSERLRQVINKGITEDDLMAAARAAFRLGWKHLKFYFMFGLPTETDADISAIVDLVKKAAGQGGGGRINVSVATFVPKPHTPFQRQPQMSITAGRERIGFLKKMLPGKRFSLKWHDPEMSWLEGLLCRGDRRLAPVIEAAWRDGARLDAWSEWFCLDTWTRAIEARGINAESYHQGLPSEAPLPWDHLDCGVDPEFLAAECDKADRGEYTPDCRYHGCRKCGLCDFKTVMPRVAAARDDDRPAATIKAAAPLTPGEDERKFSYVMTYSRTGPARFFGHLDVIQLFYRILRRSRLPLRFSRGFNPIPQVSFGPALPLGMESMVEFIIFETTIPIGDPGELLARINATMPPGVVGNSIRIAATKMPDKIICRYLIKLPIAPDPAALAAFNEAVSFIIKRRRKGRVTEVDLRPMVRRFALAGDDLLELEVVLQSSRAGVRPEELVRTVFALDQDKTEAIRITKTWCDWPPMDTE